MILAIKSPSLVENDSVMNGSSPICLSVIHVVDKGILKIPL